ncbi:hypothetical protein HPP92_008202 [Vanilla planifolia]|uniref:Uncharacterized protein n=1 Tax=Vanilla planifolia TaxID=51239 RepID=A0A835RHZ0_VANPL|nr:hypothetical protein HPP92_008202 [Vanilla planifolia]
MAGYFKIGRGSAELPWKPQPSEDLSSLPFSPAKATHENPRHPTLITEQWTRHGMTTLRRSSSSVSQRFAPFRGADGLQSAVRRAFSMRRSSSICNGYLRMHTGSAGFVAEEEEIEVQRLKRGRKKASRSGFFGTCRKFMGL